MNEAFAATVHRSWAADLSASELYEILRLRVDVFVVEQACAYDELDGRDLEPRARHYWLTAPRYASPPTPPAPIDPSRSDPASSASQHGELRNPALRAAHTDTGQVLGCVRLLKEPGGGYRVGRLCTAAVVRGRGLGRRLLEAVLGEVGDGSCVIEAQEHAAGFYRSYGFEARGPVYDWVGVPHLPMRRDGRT